MLLAVVGELPAAKLPYLRKASSDRVKDYIPNSLAANCDQVLKFASGEYGCVAAGHSVFPLGTVGYDYRQLNGDSGSGDTVGPFRGSDDAIGAGLSYTTVIDKRPVIYNLRYYHDYNFDNHFHGDTAIGSVTVRF